MIHNLSVVPVAVQTIIPCNSDTEVPKMCNESVFDKKIAEWRAMGGDANWTTFMDGSFSALANAGVGRELIRAALESIRIHPALKGALIRLKAAAGKLSSDKQMRLRPNSQGTFAWQLCRMQTIGSLEKFYDRTGSKDFSTKLLRIAHPLRKYTGIPTVESLLKRVVVRVVQVTKNGLDRKPVPLQSDFASRGIRIATGRRTIASAAAPQTFARWVERSVLLHSDAMRLLNASHCRACPLQSEAMAARFPELACRLAAEPLPQLHPTEAEGAPAKPLRVVYVGDGGNDLCPCLRVLREQDLALPRR